jgi:hypothetical protein
VALPGQSSTSLAPPGRCRAAAVETQSGRTGNSLRRCPAPEQIIRRRRRLRRRDEDEPAVVMQHLQPAGDVRSVVLKVIGPQPQCGAEEARAQFRDQLLRRCAAMIATRRNFSPLVASAAAFAQAVARSIWRRARHCWSMRCCPRCPCASGCCPRRMAGEFHRNPFISIQTGKSPEQIFVFCYTNLRSPGCQLEMKTGVLIRRL